MDLDFTLSLTEIKVIGLITSFGYQKAKLYTERLYKHIRNKFTRPIIRGMLEVDWLDFITKLRRSFGEQLWASRTAVVVYMNDKYIGNDDDLLEYIVQHFLFSAPLDNALYFTALLEDYRSYLQGTKRAYAYLDIRVGDNLEGTMLFELYSDLLPLTCGNFTCLCTGELGKDEDGVVLHYKGSLVHRIVKMGWIQCGDIANRTGGGGVSALGPTFPDESYCVSHDRRGVLSMANNGKHSNASQFFITLAPTTWMDRSYVAFGQLVEGEDVLKSVESVETYCEAPVTRITISKCGVLDLKEKKTRPLRMTMLPDVVTKIPSDVADLRDVPSFLTEEGFLKGLYSYTIPEDLGRKAFMEAVAELGDSFSMKILDYLVRKAVKEHGQRDELMPDSVNYARLVAGDIARQSIIAAGEYETKEARKVFAVSICDEMLHSSIDAEECDALEEKRVIIREIAEEIVRKSTAGPYFESEYDISDFISVIAEKFVRNATEDPERPPDLFAYSMLLAQEIVAIAGAEVTKYHYDVYEEVHNKITEAVTRTKEVVDGALSVLEDIVSTIADFMRIKEQRKLDGEHKSTAILDHIVRTSILQTAPEEVARDVIEHIIRTSVTKTPHKDTARDVIEHIIRNSIVNSPSEEAARMVIDHVMQETALTSPAEALDHVIRSPVLTAAPENIIQTAVMKTESEEAALQE